MIITDTGEVKIGELILPGLFKSLEIEGDSKVDEVEVKGKSTKPKQATGFEDAKIKLKLILKEEETSTILDKLSLIQSVFRVTDQEKPIVHNLINLHCNTRGINQVIFKKMKSKEDNKNNLMEVECEFWEYIPIVIQASQQASTTSPATTAATVSPEFRAYLNNRSVDQQSKAEAADAANALRYQKAYEAHQKQRAIEVANVDAKRYEEKAKYYSKQSKKKFAKSPAVDNDKPKYGGRV